MLSTSCICQKPRSLNEKASHARQIAGDVLSDVVLLNTGKATSNHRDLWALDIFVQWQWVCSECSEVGICGLTDFVTPHC